MNKGPTLNNEEWDSIYIEMLEYFVSANLYDLADKAKELVFDPT